ncbi:MAG: acyl carrier protein [Candidatus Rokubacteria bacterium]|nr:acyl carrier protein [Candidatus Rokubacteria bacterium]
MSVAEKVKEIILKILDVKEDEVTPAATLIDDLQATSIDLVEIFTAFENTFDVEIDSKKGEKIVTVQDAIDMLNTAIAEKGA